MASALESILELRTSRFNGPGAYRETVGGVVLIMNMVAVGCKILDLPLKQFADYPTQGAHVLWKLFQGAKDLGFLPGTEEAVTDKEFKRASPAVAKEVYFLQVAAFQNPSDADNLKARLALAGIETQIQTATLPDGQVWHRVRVGPFSSKDELVKSRAALKENKLEANLIKVRE